MFAALLRQPTLSPANMLILIVVLALAAVVFLGYLLLRK